MTNIVLPNRTAIIKAVIDSETGVLRVLPDQVIKLGATTTSLSDGESVTFVLSAPLSPARGGTGVNNGANTLTLTGVTTITDGGTLALGGYTLTVPKTGTAVVGTGAAGRIAEWVTDANTLQASTLAKTGAGVLTLSAAGDYTLTVPATGTAALLNVANAFTAIGQTIIQTVNQTTTVGLDVQQIAEVLQDGSAFTGVDTTMATQYIAVKFTATAAHTVGDITVRIKSSATLTNPTQSITGYIYSDAGGVPGTALATGQIVFYGALTTTYQVLSVGTQYTLTAGATYWLVIKWSAAPAGGNIVLDSSTAANAGATSTDEVTWTNTSAQLRYQIRGRTHVGVAGSSTNSYGVYGFSTNSLGVHGLSTNSYGVYGFSTNSLGVHGLSTNSYGVYGLSTNSLGVYGRSTNSHGVYGFSTNSYGVYGFSTNSYGVYGFSTNSYGVNGFSTNSYAGVFNQTGSLTQNNTGNVVRALRSLTLGAYTATGAVLSVESAVADTGPLVQVVKQGTTYNIITSTGLVGFGTGAPSTLLHGVLNNSTTSSVDAILTLTHNTTGTAATGFGGSIALNLESSTTADQAAASIDWLWTDATHATRTALYRGKTTGNATNTGYYGHWNYSAVAGSAITVIPNGSGDVTEIATFIYAVAEVTGAGTSGGTITITPGGGAVTLYSDGTDTLQITCAADGSVTVQRSAGTDTFKVSLWGTWV